MFTKKILAAAITSQPSASGVADAIDFDGATDYLSRSSDLVGNADGKTFTFSAWVYIPNAGTNFPVYYSDTVQGEYGFWIQVVDGGDGSGSCNIVLRGAYNGTIVLTCSLSTPPVTRNTYVHLLMSFDMANQTVCKVRVNDIDCTVSFSTFSNSSISFRRPQIKVGWYNGSYKGRLSHVFLAYEYIDLSIESNRRIFITADRKPA